MEIGANFPQQFLPLELGFKPKYIQEMDKAIHNRHPKPVFRVENSAQIFRESKNSSR
jgi:hypothetical protein